MSSAKDILYVKGSYVSKGSAEIRSNGTVYITDSLVNKSKTGQVFSESGQERVVFSGNRTGYIKGLKNSKIQNLTMNKTGKDLVLLDTLMVRQRIEFVSGNIELRNGNLEMGNSPLQVVLFLETRLWAKRPIKGFLVAVPCV